MEQNGNGNGNTVLLTVIGVATLLVALVGATFAYFTTQSVTNNDSQVVSVNTKAPTALTYTAGDALQIANAIPGKSDTKTFRISSSDSHNTHVYELKMIVDTNTFVANSSAPKGDENYKPELVFTFTGKSNKDADGNTAETALTLTTASYDATGAGTDDVTIVTNQQIRNDETHTFTAEVEFKDTGINQSWNTTAQFAGHFSVTYDRTVANNAS